MKNRKTISFTSDTELHEKILLTGENKVEGNITTESLDLDGNLYVTGQLRTLSGSIKVQGTLTVDNDISCSKSVNIKGETIIGGVIHAENIQIDGKISCKQMEARKSIILKGELLEIGDLNAGDQITIFINKFKQYNIKGIISAPIVEVKYRSMYSNLYEIPAKLLKIFGKKKKVRKEVTLEALNIESDKLIVTSYFPPEEIKFIFSDNCNITSKQIEFIREKTNPEFDRKWFQIENEKEDE
ncbi:MAG: hypothetical protein ACFFD1_01230 [Candidatus Thorarchaeota archaeon]